MKTVKITSRWIVFSAFVALLPLTAFMSGCDPKPSTTESPVSEASPATDDTKVAGPPAPPPGPKAPDDFDKKPFKGNGKVVKTASGLQYEDMTVGKGVTAAAGMTCSMHYTGTLTDGTKFDSSRDRGTPFDFALGAGQVIKGWDEGVAGMKVGGRRKLTIPYPIAYGEEGHPPVIPPKATLIFDVELMDAK